MPLKLALDARETVAGRRLGALDPLPPSNAFPGPPVQSRGGGRGRDKGQPPGRSRAHGPGRRKRREHKGSRRYTRPCVHVDVKGEQVAQGTHDLEQGTHDLEQGTHDLEQGTWGFRTCMYSSPTSSSLGGCSGSEACRGSPGVATTLACCGAAKGTATAGPTGKWAGDAMGNWPSGAGVRGMGLLEAWPRGGNCKPFMGALPQSEGGTFNDLRHRGWSEGCDLRGGPTFQGSRHP